MEENQTRLIGGPSSPSRSNSSNPSSLVTSRQSENSIPANTANSTSLGHQQTARVESVLKNFNPKSSPSNVSASGFVQRQASNPSPSSPRSSSYNANITGFNQLHQQSNNTNKIKESDFSSPRNIIGTARRQDCKATNNTIASQLATAIISPNTTGSSHQQDCNITKSLMDTATLKPDTNQSYHQEDHATSKTVDKATSETSSSSNNVHEPGLCYQQEHLADEDEIQSTSSNLEDCSKTGMVQQQDCDREITTDKIKSCNGKTDALGEQQDFAMTEVVAESPTTSPVEAESSATSSQVNGVTVTNTSSLDECQELFSDDDDDNTVVKCHEVSQQISQIQKILNNQRLRTNKKRKHPS